MYSFAIQKTKEHLDADSAILVESIDYQKFMGNNDYIYFTVDNVESIDDLSGIEGEIIPIGTVEFVKEFIDKYNLPSNNFKPLFLNNEFTKQFIEIRNIKKTTPFFHIYKFNQLLLLPLLAYCKPLYSFP